MAFFHDLCSSSGIIKNLTPIEYSRIILLMVLVPFRPTKSRVTHINFKSFIQKLTKVLTHNASLTNSSEKSFDKRLVPDFVPFQKPRRTILQIISSNVTVAEGVVVPIRGVWRYRYCFPPPLTHNRVVELMFCYAVVTFTQKPSRFNGTFRFWCYLHPRFRHCWSTFGSDTSGTTL